MGHWLRVFLWIAVLPNCRGQKFLPGTLVIWFSLRFFARECLALGPLASCRPVDRRFAGFSRIFLATGFAWISVSEGHLAQFLHAERSSNCLMEPGKMAELLSHGPHDVVDAAGNTIGAVGNCFRITQIPSGRAGPSPASPSCLRYDILQWRLSFLLGLLVWLLAQSSASNPLWSLLPVSHEARGGQFYDDFSCESGSRTNFFHGVSSSSVLMEPVCHFVVLLISPIASLLIQVHRVNADSCSSGHSSSRFEIARALSLIWGFQGEVSRVVRKFSSSGAASLTAAGSVGV